MIFFQRSAVAPFYRRAEYGPGVGNAKILEISSRSGSAVGRGLSARSLLVAGSDGKRRILESVYQAAKDYGTGAEPAIEALSGFDAKRRARRRADEARAQGRVLTGFRHAGVHWPAETGTAFYDHLWAAGALDRHGDRLKEVLEPYDGFSDCFFRPGLGRACQAAAAAAVSHLLQAQERQNDPLLDGALRSPDGWAAWRGRADRARTPGPAEDDRRPAGDAAPAPSGRPSATETEERATGFRGQPATPGAASQPVALTAAALQRTAYTRACERRAPAGNEEQGRPPPTR